MARKKEKKSRVRYIGPGMSDILEDERSKKKGKKHIRKPKMPAWIKKNQTHRRKR